MKKNAVVERIGEIVRDEVDAFASNIMIKVGDQYHLFETYTVVQQPDRTVTVTKTRRDPRVFSRMRSAVAWCIADKFQHYETTRAIAELDSRCAAVRDDIAATRHTAASVTDTERKQILYAKLSGKQSTLQLLENQLTKCVNLAKYWQIKGFIRDETARPRNPKNTR